MWNMLIKVVLFLFLCASCWGQVIFLKKASGATCGDTPIASIGALGVGNSTSSGTSLVVTTSATLEAGNLGIAIIGKDNACTTDGETSEISAVADSASNTWNKLAEFCNTDGGSANDASSVAIWYTIASSQLTSGGTVTITMGTTTSKSAVIREYSLDSDCSAVAIATNGKATAGQDGAVDPPSMSLSSLASKSDPYLFVRGLSLEKRECNFTPTTNFTATACEIANNAGGGGASITTTGEFRILGSTTTQTSDPADNGTDVESANLFLALEQTP